MKRELQTLWLTTKEGKKRGVMPAHVRCASALQLYKVGRYVKEDAAANASYLLLCSLLGGQKEKNIWTLLADHKHEREMPPLMAVPRQ